MNIQDASFIAAVERLRMPSMGTAVVAPLLSSLVQLVRPRRVLEVGMGYTTPFLAATLEELEKQSRIESLALAEKSRPYVDGDVEFDDHWLNADPALLTPSFYLEPYQPEFVAVDNMSMDGSSAPQVQEVLRELGLEERVTIVNADLHDCIELLPAGFAPIDLAWVDAWECLYFFDHFWDLINPDGGLIIMHYLMTYPEGEAILDYIADVQHARPGELEIVNLLEPHKLAQNSLTVLRRTSAGKTRIHAESGNKMNYGGTLRKDAGTHVRSARPAS
jgi:predicted O-methyltransferase YrrM